MEGQKNKIKRIKCVIDGTSFVNLTIVYEDKTEINKKMDLIPVDSKQLLGLRLTNHAFLIIKSNNNLFYCFVPKQLNVSKHCSLSEHKCTNCNKYFSSCQKISDRFFREDAYEDKKERVSDMYYSKRIEKYPFIKSGVESVNTVNDCFVVLKCSY